MKMSKIVFAAFTLLLIGSIFFFNSKEEVRLESPQTDWFFMQRAYPEGRINEKARMQAMNQAAVLKTATRDEQIVWENKGPYNIGGRIVDLEMPLDDQNTIYVGSASGGVFRSTDFAQSWEPIFDDAMSLSIGDIAIAPSNSQVIYVGTGEANGGGGSQTYDGVGIYRSDDGGDNWQHLGLEESRNVGRMVVDPTDENILYVAAMGDLFGDNPERGVFKTTDGGQTWDQVLYVNDSTGAIEILMHPENPNVLFAATWQRVRRPHYHSYGGDGSDIYKSIDGGANWIKLTNGLPDEENAGRIGITICQSQPGIMYAMYMDKTGYFKGIYKSSDTGETWETCNSGSIGNNFASYGWWFGRIRVHPNNPDKVYALGLDVNLSENGGQNWGYATWDNMHVDQHSIFIHPQNDDIVLYGNDGGLYVSVNGGDNVDHIDKLPMIQFYTCEFDEQHPERL
ncbi:MAG: hypothetical protein JEZ03_15785, partial [Bacteroidales bacterium]|nr:hypothetical protein [Bacteroidales bacterium]